MRVMQLAIEMGDGSSESLRVEADGPIVIGRDESCHVVLPSPDVSRRHVTLELEGDHLKITDTSANGTYYGEKPERCITSASAVIESRSAGGRSGPGAQCFDHFARVREAADLLLGEDPFAVGTNLEDTARALDQRRLPPQLRLDRGRQTGGPGEVVSDDAVLDGDRGCHGIPSGADHPTVGRRPTTTPAKKRG